VNIIVQTGSVVGAVLILLAFFCLQRGWWTSNGRVYLWSNFIGAIVLAVVAVYEQLLGFVLLESIWAAVSLAGIMRKQTFQGPSRSTN